MRNIPLDLALAQSRSGLFIQLRYGTFVLFDTGDLDRLANGIAELLVPGKNLADPDRERSADYVAAK